MFGKPRDSRTQPLDQLATGIPRPRSTSRSSATSSTCTGSPPSPPSPPNLINAPTRRAAHAFPRGVEDEGAKRRTRKLEIGLREAQDEGRAATDRYNRLKKGARELIRSIEEESNAKRRDSERELEAAKNDTDRLRRERNDYREKIVELERTKEAYKDQAREHRIEGKKMEDERDTALRQYGEVKEELVSMKMGMGESAENMEGLEGAMGIIKSLEQAGSVTELAKVSLELDQVSAELAQVTEELASVKVEMAGKVENLDEALRLKSQEYRDVYRNMTEVYQLYEETKTELSCVKTDNGHVANEMAALRNRRDMKVKDLEVKLRDKCEECDHGTCHGAKETRQLLKEAEAELERIKAENTRIVGQALLRDASVNAGVANIASSLKSGQEVGRIIGTTLRPALEDLVEIMLEAEHGVPCYLLFLLTWICRKAVKKEERTRLHGLRGFLGEIEDISGSFATVGHASSAATKEFVSYHVHANGSKLLPPLSVTEVASLPIMGEEGGHGHNPMVRMANSVIQSARTSLEADKNVDEELRIAALVWMDRLWNTRELQKVVQVALFVFAQCALQPHGGATICEGEHDAIGSRARFDRAKHDEPLDGESGVGRDCVVMFPRTKFSKALVLM